MIGLFATSGHLFLIPGDSPVGLRLPIKSLPELKEDEYPVLYPNDPTAPRAAQSV